MSAGSGFRPTWRPVPLPPPRQGASAGEMRAEGVRGRAERRASSKESVEGRLEDPAGELSAVAGSGDSWPVASGQDDGSDASGSGDRSRDGTAEAAYPEPGLLDPRLGHVARTIAMVCRHEPAQCLWSARIPLDAELLPDTVLHLAYSPLLLALRFETTDWQVRSLLQDQLSALEAQARTWMPVGAEVSATL